LRLYELLFIVNPDSDDEKIQSVITRYKEVIENGNGVLKSAEKWGKRRFAYEINDQREGLYILMFFESSPEVPGEIDRLMKIDQDIIRHVIVRKDESIKRQMHHGRPSRTQKGQAASVKVVKEETQAAESEVRVEE
jgi:small subunit ribosomal protein S6